MTQHGAWTGGRSIARASHVCTTILALCGAGAFGCSSSTLVISSDIVVTIKTPVEGTKLDAGDDCDTDRAGLQVRVEGTIVAPEGSTATAKVGTLDAVGITIGLVDGDARGFTACLDTVDGTGVSIVVAATYAARKATNSATVTVDIDSRALPMVTITSPANGARLGIGADCNPTKDGFQVRVQATVDAIEGTVATVQVAGAAPISAAIVIADGKGTIDACLDAPEGDNLPIIVAVNNEAQGKGDNDTVSVTIDIQPPPNAISDLAFLYDTATRRTGAGRFQWTAVGDADGGRLKRYELRCADAPITNEAEWSAANVRPLPAMTASPGTAQTQDVQRIVGKLEYCSLRAFDAGENPTPLASPASITVSIPYLVRPVELSTAADKVFSATPVGDVNGDGLPDVLVGAKNQAFLWFGAADPAAESTFDVSFAAAAATTGGGLPNCSSVPFGSAVAALGDINADGRSDFAVSFPSYDACRGRVYVFFGRAAGNAWPSSINLGAGEAAACNADLCIAASGTDAIRARFGSTVAGIGDFDGDGVHDIAIGAPLYGRGSAATCSTLIDAGRVLIVKGGAGIASTVDRQVSFDRSAPAPTEPTGFVLTPSASLYRLGATIAGVGNVDSDALADFVIGAPGSLCSPGTSPVGALVQISGRAYTGPGLQVLDGTQLATIDTGSVNVFGQLAAAAGDYDGDGRSDLIASEGTPVGGVRVYLQRAGGYVTGVPTIFIIGSQFTGNNDNFGRSVAIGYHPALAALSGDLDKDGRSDLAIGSTTYQGTSPRAEIFRGRATVGNLTRADADLQVIPLPAISPVTTDHERRPSFAGDVNNDGWPDFVVGDNGYAGPPNVRSRLIVYY